MKCRIEGFIVCDSTHPYGASRAVHRCATHDYPVDGPITTTDHGSRATEGTMCSIGRIEDAVEKGIERIEAALKGEFGQRLTRDDLPSGTILPFIATAPIPDGWEPLQSINLADYPDGVTPMVYCKKVDKGQVSICPHHPGGGCGCHTSTITLG